jgi:hypothetical protein
VAWFLQVLLHSEVAIFQPVEGDHMRVDAANGQQQNHLASMIVQPKREAAQGQEPGSNARVQKAAAAMSEQARPQDAGTKVDILA